MKLAFVWDEIKAKANFKKHKVSFEEGKTIFGDPFLVTFTDREHSTHEERYINVGLSARGRIVVLVHTEREQQIRIISCRRATARERAFYEKGNF